MAEGSGRRGVSSTPVALAFPAVMPSFSTPSPVGPSTNVAGDAAAAEREAVAEGEAGAEAADGEAAAEEPAEGEAAPHADRQMDKAAPAARIAETRRAVRIEFFLSCHGRPVRPDIEEDAVPAAAVALRTGNVADTAGRQPPTDC
ncbi:MAG: hypothetical protein HOV83_36550 [Catenulispora sp.]|nr:hypothetical protein [Catenulispora sp.]